MLNNKEPHDLKQLGVFHGLRDRRQQFIDILTQTSEKGAFLSLVIGIAHYYSGAEGSPFQRSGYVLSMSMAFYVLKRIYTCEISNWFTTFIQKYCTTIYLFIIAVTVTESMIFQSPHAFAFTPT